MKQRGGEARSSDLQHVSLHQLLSRVMEVQADPRRNLRFRAEHHRSECFDHGNAVDELRELFFAVIIPVGQRVTSLIGDIFVGVSATSGQVRVSSSVRYLSSHHALSSCMTGSFLAVSAYGVCVCGRVDA